MDQAMVHLNILSLEQRHRDALADAILCNATAVGGFRDNRLPLVLATRVAEVLKGQDFNRLDNVNLSHLYRCAASVASVPYILQEDENGEVDPQVDDRLKAAFWILGAKRGRCADAVAEFVSAGSLLFGEG